MAKTKFLKVNAVECLTCHVRLMSLYRHDYQACKCGTLVDGGFDYTRRGWSGKTAEESYRVLPLYWKVKK